MRLVQGTWVPDPRLRVIRAGDAAIEVRITNQARKVNPNTAPVPVIQALLGNVGVDAGKAAALARAIVDWRVEQRPIAVGRNKAVAISGGRPAVRTGEPAIRQCGRNRPGGGNDAGGAGPHEAIPVDLPGGRSASAERSAHNLGRGVGDHRRPLVLRLDGPGHGGDDRRYRGWREGRPVHTSGRGSPSRGGEPRPGAVSDSNVGNAVGVAGGTRLQFLRRPILMGCRWNPGRHCHSRPASKDRSHVRSAPMGCGTRRGGSRGPSEAILP